MLLKFDILITYKIIMGEIMLHIVVELSCTKDSWLLGGKNRSLMIY